MRKRIKRTLLTVAPFYRIEDEKTNFITIAGNVGHNI